MSAQLPSVGHLLGWMAMGAAAGGLYAATNTFMDVVAPQHPLLAVVSGLHAVVDRVIPPIAGALFGVAVHAFRLRTVAFRLAAEQAGRLATRLQHVERDQAVWVVAAATLHDLRNPLHTLGLLLEEADMVGEEGQRDLLLSRARTKVEELHERLARLRALASGPRPTFDVFDLGRLASDVSKDLHRSLGGPIVVECEVEPATVRGDPTLVRIILENLVCNAIDALRLRGHGRVLVTVVREGDEVRVGVSDDGPGLPEHVRDGKFVPLPSSKEGGLGLGLSIARALARAMDSDLVPVERPGYSTTMELRLPQAGERP